VSKDAPPERIKVVSEAIYSAMVEIANVPLHDKFQVVTRHAADEIIYRIFSTVVALWRRIGLRGFSGTNTRGLPHRRR
jgi:hypothetical protein